MATITVLTIQIPNLQNPLPPPGSISPGGTVNFKNNGSKTVTVDFGSQDPFCPLKPPFNVAVGATVKKAVCANYSVSGTHSFRVTAGADARTSSLTVLSSPNPIVFPEKTPIVFPEDWVSLLVAFAIGAIFAFVVGPRIFNRTAKLK